MRIGDFIKNIWQGAGDLIQDLPGIIAEAPGAVRDFSDQLADIIYGGGQDFNQQMQQQQTVQQFRDEATEFYARQAGDRVGQKAAGFLSNPNAPLILLVIVGGIIAAIMFKDK